MNISHTKLAAIAMALSLTCLSFDQGTSIQTSYFPSNLVSAIVSQPNCAGIRMYPAMDASRNANALMIIGIDASGNELYGAGSATTKYQVFSGIVDGSAQVSALDQSVAQSACNAYKASGSAAFLSDISASALSPMLGSESSGIMISYNSSNGNNFTVQGYKSTNGSMSPIGTAVAGEPCPAMCGQPGQYLCPPN